MDEGTIAMLVMPLVVFSIFVAPIWLILHYRSKKQEASESGIECRRARIFARLSRESRENERTH